MDHNKTKSPRRQNDKYLKDIFEQIFADFLRFAFPKAEERFDLSKTIGFLDKEFFPPYAQRGDPYGNRIVDLLAKVQTYEGTEEWVLVHTEIEGGSRVDLPERIFDYWHAIRKKHKREVETIVFFTGGEKQPKPSVFQVGTKTTGNRFHYQTCDIHGFSEETLMQMENPFSIVVLACRASLLEGKIPDAELNKIRIRITRKMLRQGYGKERTERFLYFLMNIIYTNDPKENEKYLEEIGTLTGGTIDMNTIELARLHGIEEGREVGIEVGIEVGWNKALKKTREEKRVSAFKLRERGFKDHEISEILNIGMSEIEQI